MKIIGWALGGILALVALVIALNMAGTFSSVATAPGRVIQRTLETDNIITNYEWFHQANGTFQTRTRQVAQFKGFLSSETNDAEKRRLRIEMAAVQQACRDLAQTYNARSTMTNRAIFRGQTAPVELDAQLCE
jgi:hypothetical protein